MSRTNDTFTRHPMCSQFWPAEPNSVGLVRALPTVGLSDADSGDSGIHERKDQVTGRYLSHRLVEGIASAVSVALRRPKIAARDFLTECLVLIDPPVPHSDSAKGLED